jgi:hypothetical protein
MEPASTGLRKIVGGMLRQCPPEEAAILAWPVVCGKEVAARTQAVAFADGNLTVEVPDATWRAQLAAFVPRYVSGFTELIGPVVREVKFRVAIGR